ncbi:helix-turn-helix domain-containing protein [Fictibacillus sp. 18YEL24]|uniref:helix-turn-helix domain-containing protein n=1 Tax=Fictibacillus sp. 18YEL24 TaxID=2745875 RepID=UPI0018CEA77B|nr:helix-turn-helix transcriptional regulator [Fictibacillus sp. 18YEL24]MBH0171464.1 helix-turn-helix transcriptional regulator [Fictibacillus sp. 18YEL24]
MLQNLKLKPDYSGLWQLLEQNSMFLTDLRAVVSSNALLKINKGEFVSLKVIAMLCQTFSCQPEEIFQFRKYE